MRLFYIAAIVCVCAGLDGLRAQPGQDASLAVDRSRPYLDIVYEKFGPRVPAFPGESDIGVWLRLRNNTTVLISVKTRREPNRNEGALLVHDVMKYQEATMSYREIGRKVGIAQPKGYRSLDIVSSIEIEPGRDLLFSVPLCHVTRSWYISVEVYLPGNTGGAGKLPRTLLEFDWSGMPPAAQRASDNELFRTRAGQSQQ